MAEKYEIHTGGLVLELHANHTVTLAGEVTKWLYPPLGVTGFEPDLTVFDLKAEQAKSVFDGQKAHYEERRKAEQGDISKVEIREAARPVVNPVSKTIEFVMRAVRSGE